MLLALPALLAYAGSSACDYFVPRERGMATTVKNWKRFVAGKHGVKWQRDFFDHRLRVSRFGNVADEENFLGSERFARLDGERVF